MNKEMELYLHIPFCARKCAYCDFLSFPQGEDAQQNYVDKLKEEIRAAGAACREYTVSTVFVGGGTPSVLKPEWMLGLFDELRASFSIAENAEITMEANPGTLTREKLLAYRTAGINRLSLGLQSTDNKELRALGRIHTWEEFLESWKLAREEAFENINIDLMSALPGQTVDSWMNTLQKTVELLPEHISAYSLIVEEGTPFFEKYGSEEGKKLLPGEEEEREMYHRTKTFLKSCGYGRYEISNYAKPGRECHHNTGYWTGVPYLGLGLGASSYFEGCRFSNVADFSEYLCRGTGNGQKGGAGKAPETGYGREFRRRPPKNPWRDPESVQKLCEKEMQEEFFFLGLRMVDGVSLKEFEDRFHISAKTVYPGLFERLVEEGAAEFWDGRFRLTDYGLDVSNYVMAEFLQD